MRLLTFLFAALCLGAVVRAEDGVFVVNRDTKVTSLSAENARNILLGNSVRFDDGTAVRLVVQTAGPVHEEIIRDFTRRSTDQFEKYWKKQVFTGKGIMPTQCASDAEVIDYVARTPGAFGYVAKSSVTNAVAEVVIR
jgi:ABC-type phosphate transport system substrate-binding protein